MVYLCGSWIITQTNTQAQVYSPSNVINKSLNIVVQTMRYKRISKFTVRDFKGSNVLAFLLL